LGEHFTLTYHHNHKDSQNFLVLILQTPEIIFYSFGYKFVHE
jgi:hypothetical protein